MPMGAGVVGVCRGDGTEDGTWNGNGNGWTLRSLESVRDMRVAGTLFAA